jgi:hypothetical protein
MRFRWSGAVAYDDQQARQRLQDYFEAIGYKCLQGEPELLMQRGSFLRGLVSAAPRWIWTRILARTHPWGSQTLVDVEFEILQRGRALQELDAEVLVEEARQMVRYLQEGDADFEQLNRLNRRAVRSAWRATLLTLALVALLTAWLGMALLTAHAPYRLLAYLTGSIVGGLMTWFLLRFLARRRREGG